MRLAPALTPAAPVPPAASDCADPSRSLPPHQHKALPCHAVRHTPTPHFLLCCHCLVLSAPAQTETPCDTAATGLSLQQRQEEDLGQQLFWDAGGEEGERRGNPRGKVTQSGEQRPEAGTFITFYYLANPTCCNRHIKFPKVINSISRRLKVTTVTAGMTKAHFRKNHTRTKRL